jgi:hypothetical protein
MLEGTCLDVLCAEPLNKVFANERTCSEDLSQSCLGDFAFEQEVEELVNELLVFGIGLVSVLQDGACIGRGLVRWNGGG